MTDKPRSAREPNAEGEASTDTGGQHPCSDSGPHLLDPPSTREELARMLDQGPVSLAEHAPAGNAEVIEIYDQPQPAEPLVDAGPMAMIVKGRNRLQLWPVGSQTFDGHREAWSSLLRECATYFNPRADVEVNWSYARYHTTTVSNALARTCWVRRSSGSLD